MNRDEFWVKIVGNLITDPKLVEDDEGNKICYCRVATNPRARKVDPNSGETLSNEERNKLRTFADLKLRKTAAAEKFFEYLHAGDRVWIEGEGGTKKQPKMYWSEVEGAYTEVQVDVDGDGKNPQTIMEDRLVIRVSRFGKVETTHGVSTVAYA
jgi:hypothetical protein